MGLLENETWDDYINKKCYVTEDDGDTGYLGYVREYNDLFVLVECDDGSTNEVKHEYVYGSWILEDW